MDILLPPLSALYTAAAVALSVFPRQAAGTAGIVQLCVHGEPVHDALMPVMLPPADWIVHEASAVDASACMYDVAGQLL